jgi:hypothetical protein
METVDSKAFSTKPAFSCPAPQWDRETIDNVRVTKFSTAKIAIFQMFFSQMKRRRFEVIFKDRTGAKKPSGTTIFPHPEAGDQYQLAWFAR